MRNQLAAAGNNPQPGPEEAQPLSDGGKNFQSVFKIAAVTRPLMCVGRICDEGHKITVDTVMSVVNSSDGSEIRDSTELRTGCMLLR